MKECPFKIGEIIKAKITLPENKCNIIKDNLYIVNGLIHMDCCDMWCVSIGITNNSANICGCENKFFMSDGSRVFNCDRFELYNKPKINLKINI